MTKKTSTHGGKRKGAGRPEGTPTSLKTFRLDKDALAIVVEKHGKALNGLVNNFIVKLSKH
jgi:hypothetical protein